MAAKRDRNHRVKCRSLNLLAASGGVTRLVWGWRSDGTVLGSGKDERALVLAVLSAVNTAMMSPCAEEILAACHPLYTHHVPERLDVTTVLSPSLALF